MHNLLNIRKIAGDIAVLNKTCRLIVNLVWLSALWVPLGASAQSITFNLKDAEIATIIGTIAEITNKNFIIDPRVKGKVTVISSRPMDKDEAYQVFLSILEVHGFAAVSSGKVIKIVPDVNAKQSTTPVASDARPGYGDETVTRVLDVKNVAAAQLVPILRPLVPQQGHMVAYAPTNVLIISDRAANIERLVKIIARIDKPSVDEDIEVFSLKHASASEVVRVLSTLVQQEKKDPASKGAMSPPVMVADERTNSILLGGDSAARIRLRAIIAHLDTPLVSEGNTHVIYLRYAKAKELVPVLTGVGTNLEQEKKAEKGKPAVAESAAPIMIQADESTNALVITGPPDVIRSLQAVIKQLDIRRAQVLVEAVIAEITSRRASELGVQWLFDGTNAGDKPVGVVNFTGGTTSIVGLAASLAAKQLPAIGSGLTLGLGRFGEGNNFNFAALISALDGDGSSNVLSTPSIVTLDNVESEIKVGQKIPFLTGSYTSIGAGGGSTPTNPFQTINREDVGITLKVTPLINEGDAIKLNIEQVVSSIAPSALPTGPVTNNRSIKTTVMVEDGQVVVLGGLITDDQNESMQKVPLLGDIPLLGNLFRYRSKAKEKTNLMVFIRPRILRDAATTSTVSNSKYDFIRAKQLEVKRDGTSMLKDTGTPLLPALDEALELPPPFKPEPVSAITQTPMSGSTRAPAPTEPASAPPVVESNEIPQAPAGVM